MWEMAAAAVYDKDKVEAYLRDGYEPFAVTQDRGEIVWFKRKVKDEIHSGKSRESKRKPSGESTPSPEA